MMNKLEAVILDWAGTTVDFGCFAPVQAFVEAFRENQIEVETDEVRSPMGMRKKDHIRTMLSMDRINKLWVVKHQRPWNEEDLDRIYLSSERKIFEILGDFSNPKPYVLEAVEGLRKMNVKIGSTTGYTDAMMKIVTQKAKDQGFETDCWVTPDSVNYMGRPYPYMIFRNMEILKISSVKNVIKVGDTLLDIKEAKNAGIIAVGVIDGSSEMGLSEKEFDAISQEQKYELREKVRTAYIKEGADAVIQDMQELIGLIGNMGFN